MYRYIYIPIYSLIYIQISSINVHVFNVDIYHWILQIAVPSSQSYVLHTIGAMCKMTCESVDSLLLSSGLTMDTCSLNMSQHYLRYNYNRLCVEPLEGLTLEIVGHSWGSCKNRYTGDFGTETVTSIFWYIQTQCKFKCTRNIRCCL